MRAFRAMSIKWKAFLTITVSVYLAAALTCTLFIILDYQSIRAWIERDIVYLFEKLEEEIGPALARNELQAIHLAMSSLASNPHVLKALVRDERGEVVAEYFKSKALPVPEGADWCSRLAEFLMDSEGIVRSKSIAFDGKVLGSVHLYSDSNEIPDRFHWYAWTVLGIFASISIMAFLLSMKFQQTLTRPLFGLIRTIKTISMERKYSSRAPKTACDETGELIDVFNSMISEIQRRDIELSSHRKNLEDEIEARTADLARVNSELRAEIEERNKIQHELERARQVAEAANEAKSRFLANMSHEIRTPISGIMMMVDVLLSTRVDVDQRHHLMMIKDSAELLLGIIHDVLDLSKIEAHKLEIMQEPFNLLDLVDSTCASFAPRARENGLLFSCQIDPAVPERLVGDPVRLRQILTNLLGNALKFTEHGEIEIRVWRGAGTKDGETRLESNRPELVRLEFCVKDTGIGIPQDKKALVFESFTQLDTGYAKKYGGTGLGLAICKHLSEQMGGEIRCESKEGEGASFYFSVELQRQAEEAVRPCVSPKAEVPVEVEAGLRSFRILLAEDNLINCMAVEHFLTSAGHHVIAAHDGIEVLEILAREEIDIVLMDVQMPRMDGLEAAKRIRTATLPGVNPQIPIIALTAYAMKGDQEKILQAGMNGYVSKPVSYYSLVQVMSQAINSKPGQKLAEIASSGQDRDIEQGLPPAADIERLRSRYKGYEAVLRSQISALLEVAPLHLRLIAEAIEALDRSKLAATAHQVAGTVGEFQAGECLTLARKLQKEAQEADQDRMRAIQSELERALNELCKTLRSEFMQESQDPQ